MRVLARRVRSSQSSSVPNPSSTPVVLPSIKRRSFDVYPYSGRVGTMLVERENRSFPLGQDTFALTKGSWTDNVDAGKASTSKQSKLLNPLVHNPRGVDTRFQFHKLHWINITYLYAKGPGPSFVLFVSSKAKKLWL